MKEFKEMEDIFQTNEFKSLSRWERFKIRLKVAFYQLISLH